MSMTYSECVFVALIIEYAKRMSSVVICSLSGCMLCFCSLSHRGTIVESKIFNVKRVF